MDSSRARAAVSNKFRARAEPSITSWTRVRAPDPLGSYSARNVDHSQGSKTRLTPPMRLYRTGADHSQGPKLV